MAGSYKHAVDDEGKLLDPHKMQEMMDTPGDRYEAIEEMYGMIWFLATRISEFDDSPLQADALVHVANLRYKEGLELSPGISD